MAVDLQEEFRELARGFRDVPETADQYAKLKQFHELMIRGSRAVQQLPTVAEAVPLCEGLFENERLLVRWIEVVNELCKRHPADLEALQLAPEDGHWMYLSPSKIISSRITSDFIIFQHLCEGFKELGLSNTADDLPKGIEYRIWVKEDQFRETASACAAACELLARECVGDDKSQYLSRQQIATKAGCNATTVSRHAKEPESLGEPDRVDRDGGHYWEKDKAEAWIDWCKTNPKKGGPKFQGHSDDLDVD